MSKHMFESSKTVRQRIFADSYFRQTRRAFTLIELLVVIAIIAILAARSRSAAGPTAPARGLFLHSVEYDGSELIEETE